VRSFPSRTALWAGSARPGFRPAARLLELPRSQTDSALGKAETAIPGLLVALKDDPDPNVRALAPKSLGMTARGDRSVAAALVKASADQHPYVRSMAVGALMRRGFSAEEAVNALTKPLGDVDSDLRGWATNALLKLDPVAAAKAGVNTNANARGL